ncbi:MAG: efflux RND transporter periplasmic adaptor subunit, partial [Campylobacterota bacterium]|nr:efflux RND transporter periplasmic adaptor subunit [Campylobacterota bacterium]
KATIQDDQAQIDRALIELDYTKIKAPISGKISNRLVDVGNLVGYDGPTKLTTINQIDPLYTYFSPSTQEVQIMNKYKEFKKMPTFIEVKNSSEYLKRGRLNGYVDFENNTVDPLTSTVNMRATLKNDKNEYLAGTFVYINLFVTDKKKFIMLPPDVIFESQLGKYVYVVDENSSANRVIVKTGYTSRFYTQIVDGLKDGDRVIVNAFMKLKEKLKVVPNDVTSTQGIDAIIAKNNLIPDVNTTK